MPSNPQTFRPHGQATRLEQRRMVDVQRGSARERGYSAAWDRVAAAFKRAHPLCIGCQAVGRIAAATVVDHVEPHKGDMVTFWDQARWQPSCAWHHDVIKKRLEAMFEQGEISLAELHLDSERAKALTRERDPG